MTNIEGIKHFNRISYFLYAWVVFIAPVFFKPFFGVKMTPNNLAMTP